MLRSQHPALRPGPEPALRARADRGGGAVSNLNAAVSAPPAPAEAPPIAPALPGRVRVRVDARLLPLAVTLALFVLMFGAGSLLFDGFPSLQVFLNLFVGNAVLALHALR